MGDVICVDFDGTCVKHEYPNVGADIGAVPVLKELVANGHDLIIFTMRSGKQLEEAVKYCKDNGVIFYGVQINPSQTQWTTSPKAYDELIIDDAAAGCPLVYPGGVVRPYVDWIVIQEIIKKRLG